MHQVTVSGWGGPRRAKFMTWPLSYLIVNKRNERETPVSGLTKYDGEEKAACSVGMSARRDFSCWACACSHQQDNSRHSPPGENGSPPVPAFIRWLRDGRGPRLYTEVIAHIRMTTWKRKPGGTDRGLQKELVLHC